MTRKNRQASPILGLIVLAVLLGGCATSGVNRDYAAQLAAHQAAEQSRLQVFIEHERTQQARFAAMQAIGSSGDAQTRAMALLALATAGSAQPAPAPAAAPLPAPPESSSDKVFRLAQAFLPPVASIAQSVLTYRLGLAQSDNARDATIASYGAFSSIAGAGFSSATSIAGQGFANSAQIANAGFGSATALGQAGSGTALGIAGLIQAPQPNITLSGTGVIGAGSFVGPNSGENSGNSGTIGNENNSPKPVTTTTTTTTTDTRNCTSGGSGTTGSGGAASC